MAADHTLALNQLLINLGRSLLQYVWECWPWTGSTSSARETLEGLAALQRDEVGRLFELLNRRGVTVDFGTFPTEYTDLHYCALSFLLKELIDDSSELVQQIESLRALCADDPPAAAVLESLAASQQKILDGVKSLATSAPAWIAA